MDLSKIIIKSVKANDAKSFVKSLEELPQDLIKGKEQESIEVYASPIDNSIELEIECNEKDDIKDIIFSAPKKASNIESGEYWMVFDYKNQHYKLTLIHTWSP